jgi:uncharacterized protein (DUF362 family)
LKGSLAASCGFSINTCFSGTAIVADGASGLKNLLVSVSRSAPFYPAEAPFNPGVRYPEYPDCLDVGPGPNPAYEAVRDSLRQLGLDAGRFGSPAWNPLGELIRPGQKVVIKPNFVLSDHYRGGDLYSIITHPSVIRAIVDYAFKALQGSGSLIIADTPQLDCDFQQLLERTQLPAITELYAERLRYPVEIRDLRKTWFKYVAENYFASQEKRQDLPGDPEGNTLINLGDRSAFAALGAGRQYYGADFNRAETAYHHSEGRHDYMVSNTILGADVLISMPKLKVHKKVGVTLNSKGLVGTVTNKNYLIHYSLGGIDSGGDQFPPNVLGMTEKSLIRLQRLLFDRLLARKDKLGNKLFLAVYQPFRRILRPLLRRSTEKISTYDGGNWHGNDSAWRMVSDLMKISVYADAEGRMQSTPQRTVISIVDGIIGGEGNGPLFPDSRPAGIILAGTNHLAVDMVAARLMGFDFRKLRWVTDLLENRDFNFFIHSQEDIVIKSNVADFERAFETDDPYLHFRPHPGWVGHLEVASKAPEGSSVL